jgi:hypothetical protein
MDDHEMNEQPKPNNPDLWDLRQHIINRMMSAAAPDYLQAYSVALVNVTTAIEVSGRRRNMEPKSRTINF